MKQISGRKQKLMKAGKSEAIPTGMTRKTI